LNLTFSDEIEPKRRMTLGGFQFMRRNSSAIECQASSILIVEDNKFNQEVLKMIIKTTFKTNIDVADDGEKGFNAFK